MKKTVFALSLVASFVLAVSAFVFTSAAFTSAAQNTNSSTTNLNRANPREIGPAKAAPPQDFSKNTWELPEDADTTKNPVATTPESIAKGKELYLARDKGNCIFCHGDTGGGNEANKAVLRRKPADLTNKERMSAMTDGELFWKITKGINGIMPAGDRKMPDAEERWHVVNYIKTLPKEPAKP